jgi:hypothetical protein
MKNADVFDLISNFSDNDRKKFGEYLISPYFHYGGAYSLDKVFNEIILNKEMYKDSDFEKIFNNVCDGLHYSKSTLNKLKKLIN